jgi:hypothetical protein
MKDFGQFLRNLILMLIFVNSVQSFVIPSDRRGSSTSQRTGNPPNIYRPWRKLIQTEDPLHGCRNYDQGSYLVDHWN